MKLDTRCFFRLGIILLFTFVLGSILDYPEKADAIVVRVRGYRFGHGSYNSNYGGRLVWNKYTRSGGRRNKGYQEPVDKNRAYYEKKMAEWREKNKELLEQLGADHSGEGDYEEDEDHGSDEYDYDYEAFTTTTPSTSTTEVLAIVSMNETTVVEAGNSTEALVDPAIVPMNLTSTEEVSNSTESSRTTTETTTTTTPRARTRSVPRGYGLRYGRIKVERLH